MIKTVYYSIHKTQFCNILIYKQIMTNFQEVRICFSITTMYNTHQITLEVFSYFQSIATVALIHEYYQKRNLKIDK